MESIIAVHDPKTRRVVINVVDENKKSTSYLVLASQRLHSLMDDYCKKKKMRRNECSFMYDGKVVKNYKTAEMLEMEDEDAIDFVIHFNNK